MTDDGMALVELLQKSGDGDFLRAVAEAVLQILMEADVAGLIGAGRHERSVDRLNYRNGYRDFVSIRASARSSCAFPSCARDLTFRRFSRRARPPRRRWSRQSKSLDRRCFNPARRRAGAGDGPHRHLKEPQSPSCARTSTNGSSSPRILCRPDPPEPESYAKS